MTAPAVTRHRELMKSVRMPFAIKAVDDSAHTFQGLASAYSLDLGGDVIEPGAFKRTLKDWRSSKGKVIPILDSHDRSSVRSVVGKLTEAEEVKDGLDITGSMIDGPDGEEVFRRLKGGFVDGLSIGYVPIVQKMPDPEQQRAGIWRILKEVKLLEVSVVIWPMNEDARIDLDSVKTLLTPGRELTAEELEELKQVQDQLTALLAGKTDTPAAPVALAPDDPRRIKLLELQRDLELRSLGIS